MKLMKTNSSRQQTKFSPETKPAEKPNCMKSEKHASGVTLRMIQLYEQRQNDISKAQVNVVISLANALGCRVEDLLE